MLEKGWISWMLFVLLCIIWGSSFILMKIGMQRLSPYEVATLRIMSAGIVLLPFSYAALKKVPRGMWMKILLSGMLGSFIPAYLFCIAETHISSSLTAIFNSLTPLCTIILGVLFFEMKITWQKALGVFIGLAALVVLPFTAQEEVSFKNISYSLLVILATVSYGLNANFVVKHLKQTGTLNIASLAFSFLLAPCLIILASTGFFSRVSSMHKEDVFSIIASCILGIFGTAIANIFFYALVKKSGALFGSLVTYGIPFVALIWGVWYGEIITAPEIFCLCVILLAVYIANKR